MQRAVLRALVLISVLLATAVQAADRQRFADTERLVIASDALGADRQVLVSLPESYPHSERSYPVLVTTDAETIHEYAVGSARYLARRGKAPELIVVGILNGDREKDLYYEPAPFRQFIETELLPEIDRRYRSSELRVLFGFSSGTGPVLHWLFADERPFRFFIAAGLGIGDSGYERIANALPDYRFTGQRAYLSTEGTTIRRKNVVRLHEALQAAAPSGLAWRGHIFEEVDHGGAMPRGFYEGLEYLFEDWSLPADAAREGPAGVRKHVAELAECWGTAVTYEAWPLVTASYGLIDSDVQSEREAALQLLEHAVKLEPWRARLYVYLAAAQRQLGKSEVALQTIDKAIELARDADDPQLAEYVNLRDSWS